MKELLTERYPAIIGGAVAGLAIPVGGRLAGVLGAAVLPPLLGLPTYIVLSRYQGATDRQQGRG